jgi:hypothetical protein
LSGDVDLCSQGIEPQSHAGGFQVGVGAVREALPGGDLAGDVVRDAADGEVRVGVGDNDGHIDSGVEFAGAQCGGDAGVASADGNNVHGRWSLSLG